MAKRSAAHKARVPGVYAMRRAGRVISYYWQPSRKGLPKGAPRPKPINLHTTDLQAAETKAAALLRAGAGIDRSRSVRAVAHAAIDAKLALGQIRPNTAAESRRRLDRFLDHLGRGADAPPGSITKQTVADWFASVRASASLITAHGYKQTLSGVFSQLVHDGIIPTNPFRECATPTPKVTRRERFCDTATRDQLLAASLRLDDSDELALIVHLGFLAGLRLNEIIEARSSWLNIEVNPKSSAAAGTITIQNHGRFSTKSDRARTVPIHAALLPVLAPLAGEGSRHLLAPGVTAGTSKYRYYPRTRFRAFMTDHGVPWVSPHTMRHTFGSLLAIAGVSELKICRWMGISSDVFRKHYAGLSPHDPDINV